jgi:hypothetical protein
MSLYLSAWQSASAEPAPLGRRVTDPRSYWAKKRLFFPSSAMRSGRLPAEAIAEEGVASQSKNPSSMYTTVVIHRRLELCSCAARNSRKEL